MLDPIAQAGGKKVGCSELCPWKVQSAASFWREFSASFNGSMPGKKEILFRGSVGAIDGLGPSLRSRIPSSTKGIRQWNRSNSYDDSLRGSTLPTWNSSPSCHEGGREGRHNSMWHSSNFFFYFFHVNDADKHMLWKSKRFTIQVRALLNGTKKTLP